VGDLRLFVWFSFAVLLAVCVGVCLVCNSLGVCLGLFLFFFSLLLLGGVLSFFGVVGEVVLFFGLLLGLAVGGFAC